jgi:hypothetical protein
MIVFRPKATSFCVQADSIENEVNYPKYACNIETQKYELSYTQKYLG